MPLVWEGFLRSEGQVTTFMWYRAQVNELTELLVCTGHRCGTPAPGHELSGVEGLNTKELPE